VAVVEEVTIAAPVVPAALHVRNGVHGAHAHRLVVLVHRCAADLAQVAAQEQNRKLVMLVLVQVRLLIRSRSHSRSHSHNPQPKIPIPNLRLQTHKLRAARPRVLSGVFGVRARRPVVLAPRREADLVQDAFQRLKRKLVIFVLAQALFRLNRTIMLDHGVNTIKI